jgi:phage anti-repressor protein
MKLFETEKGLLISAKEIYSQLGISTQFANWIKYNLEKTELEENKDFITKVMKSTGGRPSTDYLLTINSAMLLLIKSQKNKKSIELYKEMSRLIGSNVIQITKTRKELLFEIKLNEILDGISTIIPQYKVLNYRIDFYLPELNVAIEYDEKHHNSKKKSDKDRQSEIENVLKCDFIRVAEHCEINGINQLIKLVLKKSLQLYEFTGDLSVYGEKLLSSINIKSCQEIENEKFIEILNQNTK